MHKGDRRTYWNPHHSTPTSSNPHNHIASKIQQQSTTENLDSTRRHKKHNENTQNLTQSTSLTAVHIPETTQHTHVRYNTNTRTQNTHSHGTKPQPHSRGTTRVWKLYNNSSTKSQTHTREHHNRIQHIGTFFLLFFFLFMDLGCVSYLLKVLGARIGQREKK